MIRQEFEKIISESNDPVYDFELVSFTKNTLIENKNEIPALFRYSPADYYNIRGLETESLFLSHVGGLNDIFEGISCTVDDSALKQIDDMSDIAFIKSFSEDKNNLLMWAHYASNYSGMCVEYDFSKLSDEILYHLFPVYYSERRFGDFSLKYALQEHIELKKANVERFSPADCDCVKDILALFLRKSSAWSYEKEWRIVATYPQIYNSADEIGDDSDALYGIRNQRINVSNCIKSVILGARMPQSIKDHIKEICQAKLNNIPVYSTKLSKDKYELQFILEGV